ADRTVDLLHVRRHALVALAAHARRPLQLGALTDLLLPLRADLGQVVAEVEGRARAVGAVHDADLGLRQVGAGIELGDRRVVPGGDCAPEDVREHWTGQAELARVAAGLV